MQSAIILNGLKDEEDSDFTVRTNSSGCCLLLFKTTSQTQITSSLFLDFTH